MHLEPCCCHLTVFIAPFGVNEWLVLPMGVKVGPQVFQRLVQRVLRTCPHSGPYIDDVLTGTGDPQRPRTSFCGVGRFLDSQAYQDKVSAQFLQACLSPPPVLPDGSSNPDMATPYVYDFPECPSQRDRIYFHYLCLREVFNAFARADLTVNPSKCFLLMEQVQYVGHVLCNGKRFSSLTKYEALREWKQEQITTAKALKGFLGLANWYSMYIKNYAQHAAPLMEALKGKLLYEEREGGPDVDGNGLPPKARKSVRLSPKQAEIQWNSEMVKGFGAIKNSLITRVALYLPKPGARWRLSTDTSDYAIRGVLHQEQEDGNWHLVAFLSRKLQGSKTCKHKDKGIGQFGWTVREKETYAVVCCLLKFQSWIGHQEVLVRTDHSSIVQWYKEDLRTVSGLLGRRGRWHEFLSRFNLVIEYHKGEHNEAPDALSRWAYPAGLAQDVSFHGSQTDMEGWSQCEEAERVRSQNISRDTYPEAFGPYSTSTVSFADQSEPRDLLLQVRAQEEIRSLRSASDNLNSSTPGTYMDADGVHLFLHDSAWVSRVQGKPSRPMRRASRQDLDSHSIFSVS